MDSSDNRRMKQNDLGLDLSNRRTRKRVFLTRWSGRPHGIRFWH
jgi:hypothetical protein